VSATARRRAAFWLTVGGVSILANFGLELVALKVPQLGLRRFVAFTHLGGSDDLRTMGVQQ
jgi:hypothetical protein